MVKQRLQVADRVGFRDFRAVPDAARLFVESSTPRASLALLRGDLVLHDEEFTGDRSHNALLFAPLERALACLEAGETLAEVVIGTGPGSYSGTRVGIAAGQGVALVHACPAVGLSSLLAVPGATSGALAIGDARRGSGWRATLDGSGLVTPALCSLAELAEEVAQALAGGRRVFSLEPIAALGLAEEIAGRIERLQPRAIDLARAWRSLDFEASQGVAAQPVQPAYLRPPHVTTAKPGHPLLRK
jgi:tRNA threonylcarbamoyl adenosine modification protein YeaZ